MALITNDNAYQTPTFGGSTHHSHNHSDILADIRKDIGDAQSTIKDNIQSMVLSQNVEFRHLDNRICETEKEAIKNALENRVKLMEVECSLSKEILNKAHQTEKEIHELKVTNLLQFEKMDDKIGRGFCELKESGLRAQLDCKRDELEALRCAANTQSSLDRILAAIAGIPVVSPLSFSK